MSDKRVFDVAVLGGGLSGTRAASLLAAEGASVVLLEARDRVGGRNYSVDYNEYRFDLGGQWVGPTQDRVYKLIRELNIKTFPQYCAGETIIDLKHRTQLVRYKGMIPKLSLAALVRLQMTIWRLDYLASNIPIEQPTRWAEAATYDNMSCQQWIDANLSNAEAKAVLVIAVEAFLCTEPANVSMLYLLFYVRSAGGFDMLGDIPNGAQRDRVLGGCQQLSEGMLARLKQHNGCEAVLEAPVLKIQETGRDVRIETAKGTYVARYVISCIPAPLASEIKWSPELPQNRASLISRMAMGHIIKCLVMYAKPFWRERGLAGYCLTESDCCKMLFDACTPVFRGTGPEQAALVVFLDASAADIQGARTKAQREATITAELVKLLGPEAANNTGYLEKDWVADPYARGCYVAYMKPGAMTTHGDALRQPVGRVHWGGTETAYKWCGYMEGAIEAGERSASEVLARLTADAPSKFQRGEVEARRQEIDAFVARLQPRSNARYFAIAFTVIALLAYIIYRFFIRRP